MKVLRVQPTPSTHHSSHTHDILSPSSFPPPSASSPSSYAHHSTSASPSRIQHASFHAARQHALRLQQAERQQAAHEQLLLQRRLERLKAPGNKRVSLWDTLHNRKISGFASPLQKNLGKYLELHPHCIVYETYLAEKGLTDGKKKKGKSEEKKQEESSSEEDKSDDGSSSDSSDTSSSSDASSSSGSHSGSSSMSPAPSDGGSEEPNSAPPSTAAIERQTSESAEAEVEDEEVESGSSGRASDHDSDNSSLSENDSMKTEDDTDSLPTSTISYYAPAAPPAPTPVQLPPPTVETAPVQLAAPIAKHRPPPFSLSSLPFIPRLYTPQPDPLPFEPFIAAPLSPVASSAISASRAEPMSPPSPLSSVRFSTSEEEDEGHKNRPRVAGMDEMEDDPLSLLDAARELSSHGLGSLAPSLYFSPAASPLHSTSTSLTPMVAALHTSASPSPSASHTSAPPNLALPPAPQSVPAFALPSLLSPSGAQWGMSSFLFERMEPSDVTMEV